MMPRARPVWVVLVLLPAGCGGGSYKTAPVSGRVMLDSKPLANAMVQFVPVAGAGEKEPLPSSVGTTDENGRYTLVLTAGSKANASGAVVGKHRVLITLGAKGGSTDTEPTFHKQLPQRYNRKTKLECEVPAKGRDDANFDLTTD
jgi:hypothetical protein